MAGSLALNTAGSLARLIVVALLFWAGPACRAQTPEVREEGMAAIHSEMLGAPVFAADGVQIGQVADISYDEDDQPARIRMTSASVLGLGTRTMEIPSRLFTVVRGAVVVDLPAEAIDALPELAEQEQER